MATDTLKIIIESESKDDGAKATEGGLKGIQDAAKAAAAAFALIKGAQAAIEFLTIGANASEAESALNNLARSAGSSGKEIVRAVQDASGFTVDRMKAMELANSALMLNVAKTPEQFRQMASMAESLGDAMGIDATEAIELFINASGRQATRMAYQLGLTIDSKAAHEKYALAIGKTASQLTEAEQKQAFLNEMLAQGTERLAELGVVNDEASESLERTGAALKDVKTNMAVAASEFVASTGVLDWVANKSRALADVIPMMSAGWAANRAVLAGLNSEELANTSVIDIWKNAFAGALGIVPQVTDATNDLTSALDLQLASFAPATVEAGNSAIAFGQYTDAIQNAAKASDRATMAVLAERDAQAQLQQAAVNTAGAVLNSAMSIQGVLDASAEHEQNLAAKREGIETEHQARLLELRQQGKTDAIQNENERYQAELTMLQTESAKQLEEDRKRWGQVVLNAFDAWAQINQISGAKALEMRTAIALNYGLITQDTATATGTMMREWDRWAGGVAGSAAQVMGSMDKVMGKAGELIGKLDAIPRNINVRVNIGTEGRIPGGPAITQQYGGWNPGGWTMTGERGMELTYMPRGAFTLSAPETRAAMGGRAGAQTVNIYVEGYNRDPLELADAIERQVRLKGSSRGVGL